MLLVHGGAAREGESAVSPTQLSVLRMIPLAHRISRTSRGRLTVVRLLNSTRGWDTSHTPAMDVRWALGELENRYGALPVALVGHSLGGRATLLAGDAEGVRSVVALNPWLHAHDTNDLGGRRVLIVHGTEDRVASITQARTVADRLARTTRLAFLEVPGGKHAMLRHGRLFESYAAEFVTATLLGEGEVRLSPAVAAVLNAG